MLNHFTFNGHSTGELGLLVSGINIYGSPSRVVEKVNIPYRSGDLLIDTGAYTNYMLTYTVDIMDNTKATAEAISKWLLGSKGYCELTDTYNPEIYRVASYYNQLDYTLSALYRYGKATITFDCKPQKYLTANQPVTLSPTTSEATSYSLSSPAMPLPLTLEGNTTQKTLSGKNLLPQSTTTSTKNGITFTPLADGGYHVQGTATANAYYVVDGGYESDNVPLPSWLIDGQTYTISGSTSSVSAVLYLYGQGQFNNRSFTVDASQIHAYGAFIYVGNGTTINANIYPQIELGSSATAYEPYCGGIPSPNPDYPQEIHSVKGDNEIRVTGKNLFNFNQWANDIGMMRGTKTVSSNSITLTATSNDCYTVYGYDSKLVPIVVQPNTTYTLSWKANNNNDGILYLFDGTDRNHALVNANNKTTKSVTFNTGSSTSIAYRFGVLYSSQSITYYDIQFEKGTATSFEPYKVQTYPLSLPAENYLANNATVSRNADLTIEAIANGGLKINGTRSSATVAIYNFATNGTSSDQNTETKTIPNGTYYITTNSSNANFCLQVMGSNSAGTSSVSTILNAPNGVLTIDDTYAYNWVRLYVKAGTYIDEIIYPQITKGTKPARYTPYGVAPIELNALSSFKDYIHKENGKWWLHKAIGTIVLDGSENWGIASSAMAGTQRFYYNANRYYNDGEAGGNNIYVISNKFRGVGWIDMYATDRTTKDAISSYGNASLIGRLNLRIDETLASTVEELKTWLASNNVQVVYVLSTPTETEITDTTLISQLNALSKAKTYDGATNIVQDGNDAEFTIKLPVPTEISSEYFGEPIITVNEVGTIVWNDSLIKVNSAPVTINSQTLQCYYYSENKNNDVEINDFPKYEQGENYIGSTMALTVVPNYWKL